MEYSGCFGVFYCILLYFLKLVWKIWKPLRDQEKIGVRSFHKISKQNMFKIHNTKNSISCCARRCSAMVNQYPANWYHLYDDSRRSYARSQSHRQGHNDHISVTPSQLTISHHRIQRHRATPMKMLQQPYPVPTKMTTASILFGIC